MQNMEEIMLDYFLCLLVQCKCVLFLLDYEPPNNKPISHLETISVKGLFVMEYKCNSVTLFRSENYDGPFIHIDDVLTGGYPPDLYSNK